MTTKGILICNICKDSNTQITFKYIPKLGRKLKTYSECYCNDCKSNQKCSHKIIETIQILL